VSRLCLILLMLFAVPATARAQATWIDTRVAVLQGLDKVTARISTFEAPVGEVVRFGGLEIVAKVCRKRPPEEEPESAAFVDIRETKISGGDKTVLFTGWMFASSPALSAMEHPVYDIWVLDCGPRKPGKSG
jgi:hypothetical protein